MVLGGAFSQCPAIQYGIDSGYHVITVDYLPNNPGHKISDEYYNISTTDIEGVLYLAEKLNIDGISAYASDPAAPTAAFVSEKLNLVGSSYKSVEILSYKQLFRAFLQEHGFLSPWYICSDSLEEVIKKYNGSKAIIKPVDSSGSKGIFVINNSDELTEYFSVAKSFSRSGRVILEELIERKGPQIHGEGFVQNGELIFALLGDQVFSPVNNLVPYSTIVPSKFHEDIMEEAIKSVESIIKEIGFDTGGINIEIIRDKSDNIYVLEIGARNGGNFMPQLMKYATGFDLVKANVDSLFEYNINGHKEISPWKYFAQVILHSKADGIMERINIPSDFKHNILEQVLYYKPGDKVNKYKNSKDVIGVLIIEIENNKQLERLHHYLYMNDWISII